MLEELKKRDHWPWMKAKEWLDLYEDTFGYRLKTDDTAYKKIRKTIDNEKLKHKR